MYAFAMECESNGLAIEPIPIGGGDERVYNFCPISILKKKNPETFFQCCINVQYKISDSKYVKNVMGHFIKNNLRAKKTFTQICLIIKAQI